LIYFNFNHILKFQKFQGVTSQFPLSVQTGWAWRSVGTATGGRAGADAVGLGFLRPAAPGAAAAGLGRWGMALAESGGWTA
jgi:hypothetical protein